MDVIKKPLRRYGSLDAGMLCRLFRSPDVYTPSSDDHTKPEDVQKFIDAALASPYFYVLGRNPKTEAFIFAPNHNFTTFQAHVGIRKDARDGSVPLRCAEAAKWMFEHTACETMVGFVRETNAGARSVLAQMGAKRAGKLAGSSKFNGEFVDELIYQLTKADFNALWSEELGVV